MVGNNGLHTIRCDMLYTSFTLAFYVEKSITVICYTVWLNNSIYFLNSSARCGGCVPRGGGLVSDRKAISLGFESRPGNASLCSGKTTWRLSSIGTKLSTRRGGSAYRFTYKTENGSALFTDQQCWGG